MAKELWLNLPVKDLPKSREFFRSLGFRFHPRHEGSDDMAALLADERGTVVMLFPETTFKGFIRHEIADTSKGNEMLISIDAESRDAVDELVRKAVAAGGSAIGEAGDQGWMYGHGFVDLDGHRWNVLYMDKSQMPG